MTTEHSPFLYFSICCQPQSNTITKELRALAVNLEDEHSLPVSHIRRHGVKLPHLSSLALPVLGKPNYIVTNLCTSVQLPVGDRLLVNKRVTTRVVKSVGFHREDLVVVSEMACSSREANVLARCNAHFLYLQTLEVVLFRLTILRSTLVNVQRELLMDVAEFKAHVGLLIVLPNQTCSASTYLSIRAPIITVFVCEGVVVDHG
mmetsp:Transcript_42434/g.109157  ORF Transcript_42434/g.109157 Transcript_42434/m.109157 type:complete len:204 (+) Transcript_42434:1865-2476(+)